jgi:hypothetical protein
MKALKFILFLLFLSPVLFIGCNNEDNIVDPPADIKEIVPLKIGNSWAYETTTYDTSGNIISTNIDSFSVVSDSLINGRKLIYFLLVDYDLTMKPDFGLKYFQMIHYCYISILLMLVTYTAHT